MTEPGGTGGAAQPGRLQVVGGREAPDPSSAVLPSQPFIGGGGRSTVVAAAGFADVDSRARRLIGWAHEESEYLRTHDVGLFSPGDVAGRNGYADEGLYELLPALQADAARLRAACGRGPLWSATKALCDQAAQDVQSYYALWQRLRDNAGR